MSYAWLAAENSGEDGAWAEASLFIAGVDASYIEALGVAFQQYAVVTGGVGGAAELRFLCPVEK